MAREMRLSAPEQVKALMPASEYESYIAAEQ